MQNTFLQLEFSELLNFINLTEDGQRYDYSLKAGIVDTEKLDKDDLDHFFNEQHRLDQEILPTLFTYREILWQPNTFPDHKLPEVSIKILKSYCEELLGDAAIHHNKVVSCLINGEVKICEKALRSIDDGEYLNHILGIFRKDSYPIIKFFINLPGVKLEYYQEAIHRLNFFIKILLTQFNFNLSDLMDPYWHISRKH